MGCLAVFLFICSFLQGKDLNYNGEKSDDAIAFPQIKGWTLIQEYPVYYPESLWDYINGAADAYLSYLFEDLHIAEYKNNDGTLIKVEVYRHKAPEYAFGIYSIERTPQYNYQDFGSQGYVEESLVHYISGNHYVKAVTNESGEKVQEALTMIAKKVEDILGDPGTIPPEFSSFPEKGRIKNSEKFISDNFLGHSFMGRVFTVDYQVGEENFVLFLMKKESAESCGKMLESYYKFTKQEVEITEGHHTIKDKYNGTIQMTWKGKRIWGILNANNPDLWKEYMEMMDK
jgi:hypothetical protein